MEETSKTVKETSKLLDCVLIGNGQLPIFEAFLLKLLKKMYLVKALGNKAVIKLMA